MKNNYTIIVIASFEHIDYKLLGIFLNIKHNILFHTQQKTLSPLSRAATKLFIYTTNAIKSR